MITTHIPTRLTRTIQTAAAFAIAACATQGQALAAGGAINSGDTAWMLTASALVLLMTIPGLAIFYGGLVRTKNAISMLMQVFMIVCIVSLVWVAVGYSLVYTSGPWGGYIGGLAKAFLLNVTPQTVTQTQPDGSGIPEYAFISYQMMFACITPALLIGAFAERMRFSACVLFIVLWVIVVYVPIAHMTWYGPAPDAINEAARAVAQAQTLEAKRQAEAALAALHADAGLFRRWGALDHAGGLVVHINAGIAGLVGALMVGKRVGYGRDSMAPHNLTMTMMGAALLWVGWFGFNGGSALKANGIASLAVINTFVAAAAAAVAWLCVEVTQRGKPSLLGLVSGLLAGLVAVTPAAGYASPAGAIALGIVSGLTCYWFCVFIKARYDYDDSLDVFGLHCAAGVIGSIAVGLLVSPALGGTGVTELAATAAGFDVNAQLVAQLKAVAVTIVWSSFASSRLYALVDAIIGLRLEEDDEDQGLDIVEHGERAYNY